MMTYRYRAVQLLFLFLLVVPTLAQATTFWDDEMENNSTRFNASGFLAGTLIPAGTMTFDTSVKFSGAGSIRLNYPSNCQTATTANQCGGAASAPIGTGTDDLWQRLYFRMSGIGPNPTASGNFVPSITAYTKMMKAQNGSTSPRAWATMGQTSSIYSLQFENTESVGRTRKIQSSISFANNRWYCLETRIKMNTSVNGVFHADGIEEQYVDGVLVGRATDILMRNTTISPTAQITEVGIFRQVGEGNIWYDRWAVGNTRIGCVGGTPPPVDTTTPTMPTALGIR